MAARIILDSWKRGALAIAPSCVRSRLRESSWHTTWRRGLHRERRNAAVSRRFRWFKGIRRREADNGLQLRYSASEITCALAAGAASRGVCESAFTDQSPVSSFSEIIAAVRVQTASEAAELSGPRRQFVAKPGMRDTD
jgi:hypothetical protein